MSQLAIAEAFTALPDTRRTAGQGDRQALCLALFTLSVTAGNRGFLAIGDWLGAYHDELVAMFAPPGLTLTVLQHNWAGTALRLDYRDYSACLSRFFGIQPLPLKPLPLTARCCEDLMRPSAMTPQYTQSGDYAGHGLYCRAGLDSRTLRSGVENE